VTNTPSCSDASRFLAQSQSRLSIAQPDNSSPSRNPSSRQPSTSRLGTRSFLQRPNMPNPYQQSASQLSRFPFSSRTPAAPAPLFFSATDEFREEDDGEEHQREVADFYALQRSRRAFGPSHYTESSEGDDEVERSSQADETEESHENEDESSFGQNKTRGIKSSWKGERSETANRRGRQPGVASNAEGPERGHSAV
jgi:hypothetical protein